MSFLLRRVRKSRWRQPYWLEAPQLAAEPLADLNTQGNALSVWAIDDDRANLDRVIRAVAATRDNLANFDYVLLDFAVLEDLGIDAAETTGGTLDEHANQSHVDLQNLTADDLCRLAIRIRDDGRFDRMMWSEVGQLIGEAVKKGSFSAEALKPNLRNKLLSKGLLEGG